MDNTTFLLHALTLLGFNSTELLPGDTCEQRLAHTEVDIDVLVYPAGDDLSMEVRYWGETKGSHGSCPLGQAERLHFLHFLPFL